MVVNMPRGGLSMARLGFFSGELEALLALTLPARPIRMEGDHKGWATMNLLSTISGSMLEGFFPKGWDLAKIDSLCGHPPENVTERQSFWNPRFEPKPCASLADFDVFM